MHIFKDKNAAFLPYICCGDPSADFTVKLAKTLVNAGADAIELGIPFSDPIADGKTIQSASLRALENGIIPPKALEVLDRIRKEGVKIPIIIMTYYNIILANGGTKFLKNAKIAGANAVIVPDVPLEESDSLEEMCRNNELGLVRMVSISSDEKRLKAISKKADCFVYVVAELGTTGARENVNDNAIALVKRAKSLFYVPVVIGFGISKPEHVTTFIKAGADGIIVGSAIIDIYSKYISGEKTKTINEKSALEEMEKFAKAMKNACMR